MIDFSERIKNAKIYLEIYADVKELKWVDLYSKHMEGTLHFPKSMILCYPYLYKRINPRASDFEHLQKELGRFKKKFKDSTKIGRSEKCESNLIYGIDCSIHKNSLPARIHKIEFDHVFPFSLGGPTIEQNRMTLCKYHNQNKSNDIHLYPWEAGEPKWLRDQINKIAKFYNVK